MLKCDTLIPKGTEWSSLSDFLMLTNYHDCDHDWGWVSLLALLKPVLGKLHNLCITSTDRHNKKFIYDNSRPVVYF